MTTEESIAAQFYAWEKRGRGWQLWDFPVGIEPPFQQFLGYYLSSVDDGRKPTALSSIIERLRGKHLISEPQIELRAVLEYYNQTEPTIFFDESPVKEIQISLPTKGNVSYEAAHRFLLSLRTSECPISFEIIGTADEVVVQLSCRNKDLSLLRSNLRAYFPDVAFKETSDYLFNQWSQCGDFADGSVAVNFGLSHEFVIPLPATANFTIDSLIGVVGALAEIESGEIALLQVLFHSTQYEWANSALWATTDQAGNSVFANAPQMSHHLKQKISNPLFAVVFRVAANTNNGGRSWELVKRLGIALVTVFSGSNNPDANELIPLSNEGYDEAQHEDDLLMRQTHRSGMILNSNELLSLVHLPSSSVRSEKFKSHSCMTKAAPHFVSSDPLTNRSVVLGVNTHEGNVQPVYLSDEQRSKHVHILGSTGSGKSTLMLNLIRQDMQLGNGLCVFDPHGDLIDQVIAHVPRERIKDVVLFDPSDSEFPISFNILQANSDTEKALLSSDLVATFRRMSTSWGDVMDSVLANAILAFVESSRGGTLFDLKRFLVEKEFRNDFLLTVSDEVVRYFWRNEFPQLGARPQSSILIRLDAFLRQKLIRNIVCQPKSSLNFRSIMDNRQILLIKLSQGLIGEENAHLLGTLLVSKLYQTALGRQDSRDRPHFWLYLDEFHHFITPSMESVLSGVRKYNIGLALAHQEFRQLQSRNQEVASSVLSNCHTRICFRLGDNDAEKFSSGFSFFDSKALHNLGTGEAIARIERSEFDFNLKIPEPERIDPVTAATRKEAVLLHSRSTYATAVAKVEYFNAQHEHPAEKNGNKNIPSEKGSSNTKITDERIVETQTPASTQSLQGRGGQHHQDLQAAIKRMAEMYGFAVELEKSTSNGAGRIDVSLVKENVRIACEVCVTSTAEYETKNVHKCLSENYEHVIVVVANRKKITLLSKKILIELPPNHQEKVKVLGLVDLLAFLRDFDTTDKTKSGESKPANQRLDFAETCAFFNVGSSTLYRWIREGRVPFFRVGREYRFDRDELVLMGRHDLSGKNKAMVRLDPIEIEKTPPKQKKEQNARYRKMLDLD